MSKQHQIDQMIQPIDGVRRMSRPTRDRVLRRKRGQGFFILFFLFANHEQDWQPYQIDPYSCAESVDHAYCTYIR